MKITIYQAENPTFRVERDKKTYKIGEYHIVFDNEYESRPVGKTDREILDWMFEMDNISKNFTENRGHTLSVGDIIEIDNNLYICDNFGWKDIEWVKD